MLAGVNPPKYHERLVSGFHDIQDKNALAWSVLDHKSEQFVTAAIATAINRKAGLRIAHIEFDRVDLVILTERIKPRLGRHLDWPAASLVMSYEAKAGQLFDFAPGYRRPKNIYVGGHLNADMVGLRRATGAGVFFMYEVADPTKHLKYFTGHTTDVDDAVAELCRNMTNGTLVAREVISCGQADETDVSIHMCVFDPNEE